LSNVQSNSCNDKVDSKGFGSEVDVDVLLRHQDDEIIHFLYGVNSDSYDDSKDSQSLESDK
jgi:hypothetical protein